MLNDWEKAAIGLVLYFGIAPALGFYIQGDRRLQRRLFATLVFMTSWQINKITLMLDSIDWYRGATKGFELDLMDVLSIALLLSNELKHDRNWKRIAPGALLYLFYVGLSALSIINAPEKVYTLMAVWRFGKAALVYVAAFQFLQEEEDLLVFLRALSFTLIVQMFVVLKMKYKDHVFQVMGWFEHQNALAMWAYMCGLALLATAMGDASKKDTRLFMVAYAACGVIVQSALSRASLVAFGLSTAVVFVMSLADRVTLKRVRIMATIVVCGAIGVMIALPTLMMRFGEERNEQSSDLRVMLNTAAADMLRDHPIGVGWNNFVIMANAPYTYGDVIDDWTRSRGFNLDPDEVHPQPESHYWLIRAENGWPGIIGYFLFITVTGVWCARGIWMYKRTIVGAFLIGVLAGLVTTYIHSNVERVLTQTKNLYTWLIFLGFIARIEYSRRLRAA